MKTWILILTVLFLTACANLVDLTEKPLIYEEKFTGNHSTLASCVVSRLHADTRSFMRILQFKYRQYPAIEASEIYAQDTRYMHNIYARTSPTNPDAVLDYIDPNPEILPHAQGTVYTGPLYAFVLMIRKIDDTTVSATLKGDQYTGGIAWQMMKTCMGSMVNP